MARLAEVIGGSRSSDILTLREPTLAKKEERTRPEPAGEVRTTIDLSLCERFASAHSGARVKDAFISVTRRHQVYMGGLVGASFKPGDRIACYLSPDGSILALRKEDDGIPCRPAPMKRGKDSKMAKVFACAALVHALERRGLTLAVRYDATWDEHLKAWVGRLRQKGVHRDG